MNCESVSTLVERLSYARPGRDPFSLSIDRLEVQAGEVVALVGPSGSGKSTLLQLLNGELVPQTGEVWIDGTRMDCLPEAGRRKLRRDRVGVVAQTLSLIDYLNGLENILLVSFMAGTNSEFRKRARELACILQVDHVLNRRPHRMSQGERQRIAICRALLLKPPVLLCDEPTGNLDAVRGEQAVGMMLDAARTQQAAVLIVTHDERLFAQVDRVLSINEIAPAGAKR